MEPALKPSERRADARYALHLIGHGAILYRHLPGGDRFEVRCLNISRGGLMVTMDPEVRTGDVMRVDLIGPVDHAIISFECSIQWMRRNASGSLGRFYAGLSFRQAPAETVEFLLQHAMQSSPVPEP